jgi:hypothetical protein
VIKLSATLCIMYFNNLLAVYQFIRIRRICTPCFIQFNFPPLSLFSSIFSSFLSSTISFIYCFPNSATQYTNLVKKKKKKKSHKSNSTNICNTNQIHKLILQPKPQIKQTNEPTSKLTTKPTNQPTAKPTTNSTNQSQTHYGGSWFFFTFS